MSSKNDVLDKLLVKANEQNISFVRISNSSSQVDPQILERIKTISSFKDYDELDRMIEDENIYAATWLGCQHGILGLLNPFDIWIIEDAHWITESVALCSLILCKKFIMVGKPKEPKMSSDESIEHPENSNENLFRRLSRMHKDEISQLSCAYIE